MLILGGIGYAAGSNLLAGLTLDLCPSAFQMRETSLSHVAHRSLLSIHHCISQANFDRYVLTASICIVYQCTGAELLSLTDLCQEVWSLLINCNALQDKECH